MVEVKKEIIEAYFSKYKLGKYTTDYRKQFTDEQPALTELYSYLMDDFINDLKTSEMSKSELIQFAANQVNGCLISLYSLIREQEIVNDLEETYA